MRGSVWGIRGAGVGWKPSLIYAQNQSQRSHFSRRKSRTREKWGTQPARHGEPGAREALRLSWSREQTEHSSFVRNSVRRAVFLPARNGRRAGENPASPAL